MKAPSLRLSFSLFVLLAVSCEKDDAKINPVAPTVACVLQGESTALPGNQATWSYEYDQAGYLSKITKHYPNGSPSMVSDVSVGSVTNTVVSAGSELNVSTLSYEGAAGGHPTMAHQTLAIGNEVFVNYKTFFFFYDTKGRLNLVGEQTDNIAGDLEWDLHIFYNDHDNVVGLGYEITTGPTDPGGSVITVEAYDDKPSPFTGIQNWPFFMHNFAWDNYDPEPILSALSKNNPLDYALNKGTPGEYLRTMRYKYNEHGYPLKRINTNKNASGEATFEQTFSYTCP